MNQQATQEIKVNAAVMGLRILIGLVVVAIIGFIGAEIRENMITAKQEKAFSSLYKAEGMEEQAMRSGGEEKAQQQNVDDLIAKWTPEKKAEYVANLKKTMADFPQTSAGFLASLKLAAYQFHDGKAADAEATLQDVVKQASDSEGQVVYKVLALESLGSLHESQTQLDKAYEDFKKASDIRENPLKPLSYLSTARVLRNQGKAKEAQDMYQKVVNEFPNSDYEKQARALMAMKVAG